MSRLLADHTTAIVRRKQLTSTEREQLTIEQQRFSRLKVEYANHRRQIEDNLGVYEQNMTSQGEMFDDSIFHQKVFTTLWDMDKWFDDTNKLAQQAMNSQDVFRKFTAALGWYEQSGGKTGVTNLLGKTTRLAKGLQVTAERTVPGEVTLLDERFFEQYLGRPKPAIKVYRGDGRGVGANSLDNFQFEDVQPGGTTDISYYGMVEHQHSNTAKNGMVSTASKFDVAHFWATQAQNYGIVYEMLVDDYLHVANLLRGRGFKDRYPGQFEVLIPGPIPASKITSATLYQKNRVVKRVTN